MNKQFKYLSSAMLIAISGAAFTSCDDWTEPESIDINYGTIETMPGYAEYCAALRDYRNSDHRLVYAWMNVAATGPTDQSQRLTAVPDSVDVIVLDNPSEIHPSTLADIRKVQSDKGMQVMYTIDYDAIKAAHTTLCEELGAKRTSIEGEIATLTNEFNANENNTDEAVIAEYQAAKAELEAKLEEAANPDLIDYVLEALTTQLSYAKTNGLDGIMFAFNGKASNHLTDAELADYNAQQLAFLGAASDWHKRNPEMAYDYLGYPQYVSATNLRDEFRTLFVRQGLSATNADQFGYYYNMAKSNGVPVERLGMVTIYPTADPEDTTGYLNDGTFAMDAMINFAAKNDVAAVGVYGIQRDYFSGITNNYARLRQLIQTVNPSIK